MSEFRPCALIPTFDNPATIGPVVERVRGLIEAVVVIDDGSAEAGREAVDRLAPLPGVHIHHRARNGGKGAAVKDGFRVALGLGFTHALQVDADGQHQLEDVPRFLEVARSNPTALVLGSPRFDASAPKGRVFGRKLTQFWTRVETYGRSVIHDPMCGFRVYPLESALAAPVRGNAMDFDPEIAVRMAWRKIPVVNIPTDVRYFSKEMGGVSHFRMVQDNLLISWMHTRLVFCAILRLAWV